MLYLIRHGLAASGVQDLDPGLSREGRRQAEATAEALSGLDACKLFSSPLRRTRETAAPIGRALGLEAVMRPDVAEVFDPSMPPEERKAMIGPLMAGRWSEQPAGLQGWRASVLDALAGYAREASLNKKPIVIVSHYIAIGVAIGAAMEDDRVVPVRIANCSITQIAGEGRGFELVDAASHAHLPPELVTGMGQALPGGPTTG